MTRATRAVIDLSALQHNLNIVRSHVPAAKIMAIIKANAYGHGMISVARALQDTDAFGVATVNEAMQLRNAGIDKPLTLLEGIASTEELQLASQHQLTIVVHQQRQLDLLEQFSGNGIRVWFKQDTGMHRLGFTAEQMPAAYKRLLNCKAVTSPIGWFTHLANADDRTDTLTPQQVEQLHKTIQAIGQENGEVICIANSAGILAWPQTHAQWVRPGIMLYGASPFGNTLASMHGLRPVMTLHSELIAIQQRRKGDRIGYNGTYVCPEDMPVGVIAIGYGDGYPRHARNGTPVLLNGKRVPLIGRVSMDMITVDLRTQPQAQLNDPVVLWGQGLPVEEIARHADTISYQLLCGVTTRVKFEYQ